MILRLFVPLTVFVLVQSFAVLGLIADQVFTNFVEDYQDLVCARRDVYERNLGDGAAYLRTQFLYLEEKPMDIAPLLEAVSERQAPAVPCGEAAYAIYREVNAKLPQIYPNWLAIDASRVREGLTGAAEESE